MKKSRVRNGAGFFVRSLQLRFFVAANLCFFTASFLRFFVAYFIVFACERPIFSAKCFEKVVHFMDATLSANALFDRSSVWRLAQKMVIDHHPAIILFHKKRHRGGDA